MNEAGSVGGLEARRLAILAYYPVDREDLSAQLDRLAALAARVCGAPIGLVSLVEADRQRFIGRFGTDLAEAPRQGAFCPLAMHASDGMVVSDAREDARFRDSPSVAGPPYHRFYASHPLLSIEGAPLGTLCVIDTQPRASFSHQQREELRAIADAVMALLERWRVEHRSQAQAARSKSAIDDLERRFQVLTDAMPQMVWSTRPSGRADYFNRGWCEYTGAAAETCFGDGWMRFLHPDDCAPAEQCWHDAVAGGNIYEVEYRLRRADGEFRWMLARGLPVHDEAGAISRWVGTCTDIQEQKVAAEQHELLTRELSHRIKNIFAVIGGLITLSLRRHPELVELGEELQQRVLALGRAHDFVRPHGDFARPHHSLGSLRGMLGSLLDAYRDGSGERIAIRGADVSIDDRSATPLALFFHELATNAAKYGALTRNEGRVTIEIDTNDPELVALTWTEAGGPPVRLATERGFGASLIEMSITRQLGGTLDYDWREEGLCVRAAIPAQAMTR